jgi:hypothetical protein
MLSGSSSGRSTFHSCLIFILCLSCSYVIKPLLDSKCAHSTSLSIEMLISAARSFRLYHASSLRMSNSF